MSRPWLPLVLLMLVAAAAAACGSSAPSEAQSPTPVPAATSFEEYAAGFCTAFKAMFRAVGNPDTGEGSVLSKALDSAVAAKDGAAAEPLAAQIAAELEAGRRSATQAGGWPPAAQTAAQLDRVLAAFEAMTAAKVAVANGAADAADPQTAFEQAGGVEAWTAMFEAYAAIGAQRPPDVHPCDGVPVSP